MTGDGALLAVRDLSVGIDGPGGVLRPVEGVSFELHAGETLGLVGESGCGKTVTALALLGLLPRPGGFFAGGSIRLEGRELVGAGEAELARLRGRRVAAVFQDPSASLNPYLTLGEQLAEGPMHHLGLSRREALARAEALLARVGVADAGARLRVHPHALSGGQRQRAMIAMALACEPALLVADEPTTALDVTLQAQILELLRALRAERGLAVLLVSHDLGVVAELCDRLLVLYAGRVVESGPTPEILARPAHPYTAALLRALPRLEGPTAPRLEALPGLPPGLDAPAPDACRFAPRCALVRDACLRGEPPLVPFAPRRARRCVAPVEEVR
jgi:oligopeptide/dipeptide ABC transporter ATP-binding protein